MTKKEPLDMKYVDLLYHKNTPGGVSTKCNFDYHNENYAFFRGKKKQEVLDGKSHLICVKHYCQAKQVKCISPLHLFGGTIVCMRVLD
jgi:hypothetical protein